MTTPAESWNPRRLLRQVNHASRFPSNTGPADRHVHLIARAMLTKHGCPQIAEDPEHCAASMLATLLNLYQTRDKLNLALVELWGLHRLCIGMDAEVQGERPTEELYQSTLRSVAQLLKRHEAGA